MRYSQFLIPAISYPSWSEFDVMFEYHPGIASVDADGTAYNKWDLQLMKLNMKSD